eukprot:Gb_06477 [translate_table: standard]
MQPYRRDRFFSSLKQVERRLASESSSKGAPQEENLHCEKNNKLFGRNPDVSPSKRHKRLGDSEEKHMPSNQKTGNGSGDIKFSIPSQYTEFSFTSPINACRAQPCMDAPLSSLDSDTAPEFFSHSDPMWMNSSGEPQFGAQKGFSHDDDDHKNNNDNDCLGKGFGGFDDIVNLCALLNLDKDFLLPQRIWHHSNKMQPCRTIVEEQGSTFYSKVAQVKGPKSDSEIEALNAWIHHFADEKKEPFRLVHLLLAKASIQNNLGQLEFPDAAQEFLHSWPPS